MDITSLLFIVVGVITVFVYYFLNHRFRIPFLVILSVMFVATYSYNLLFFVVTYTVFNYFIGLKLAREGSARKFFFVAGIVINLAQLILLKYVSNTINPVLSYLNIDADLSVISRIIIPVGVSFFTLQGIGYLINVKMGWEKPEKNFLHFLLYIIFYPRFLAGPIDRSNSFLPQLKVKKSFQGKNIIAGFRLILFGLFKKVAIADQLSLVVNAAYANLDSSNEYSLWLVLLLQPLYLYFDFSGYTDIAFGFARAYGIELRPNFNRPFLSENMTQFWKRFHISLSSWFHDYLFVRISFKYRRYGKPASIFALFLTWVLFGIWHGAGSNFMFLGLLQAIAIYYEFSTKKWRVKAFSIFPDVYRVWISRFITYLFYGTSLVFFFIPDMSSIPYFFSSLFEFNGMITTGIRIEIFFLVMGFILVFLFFEVLWNDFNSIYQKIESIWFGNAIAIRGLRWMLYFVMITIIIILNKEVQEFIYFQF